MVEKPQSFIWIYCEKCNKKLLQRKQNGIFVFRFGKTATHETVINLEIFGSLKMKCFRESCRHINVINFFPS